MNKHTLKRLLFESLFNEQRRQYDPPMNYETVIKLYGKDVADKLLNDPVHNFKMKNKIESIHQEPTLDELRRIWRNWKTVSPSQKIISDEQSKKLFGLTNKEMYKKYRNSYENKKDKQ